MGPALSPVRVGELRIHPMHHKFLCTLSIQHGLQVMGQNNTVEGCAMTGCCLTGACCCPLLDVILMGLAVNIGCRL